MTVFRGVLFNRLLITPVLLALLNLEFNKSNINFTENSVK